MEIITPDWDGWPVKTDDKIASEGVRPPAIATPPPTVGGPRLAAAVVLLVFVSDRDFLAIIRREGRRTILLSTTRF